MCAVPSRVQALMDPPECVVRTCEDRVTCMACTGTTGSDETTACLSLLAPNCDVPRF